MKHLREQPFIIATGLAALVHSTWSLGTLFSGAEPVQFSLGWFGWLIPALLIAFALDVGQIVTSAEIRSGHRTRAKYATFLVFAVATYYLQWLYIAHHMPQVDLSAGVRIEWSGIASLIRDSALWLIPGLLPLSTALYTFSYENAEKPTSNSAKSIESEAIPQAQPIITITHDVQPDPVLPPPPNQPQLPALATATDPTAQAFEYKCPDCGYSNTYTSAVGAKRGEFAHGRHCTAHKVEVVK
jgi:hypothetical protein